MSVCFLFLICKHLSLYLGGKVNSSQSVSSCMVWRSVTLSPSTGSLSAAWSGVAGAWSFLRHVGNSMCLIMALLFLCIPKLGTCKKQLCKALYPVLGNIYRGSVRAFNGRSWGHRTVACVTHSAQQGHVHPRKAKSRWWDIPESTHCSCSFLIPSLLPLFHST